MNASSLCSPRLAVRSVATRAVLVPLNFTLGTSAAVVREVPLLLVDVSTHEGITGRAYLFCYTRAGAKAVATVLSEAVEMIRDQAVHPASIYQMLLRRYALLGVTGAVRMALSALDIALWDAAAIAVRLPLAELLGSSRRAIAAYDSRGLGLMAPDKLADEARALQAKGLPALKVRLGHATLAEDLDALRAVRHAVGPDAPLMVDYNQALTPAEAVRRGLALQREGIAWLEEPIRHDDYRGCAHVARSLDVPVQIGENFNGPEAMVQAITEGACDHVMPDVGRIGGVTGWMQAAAIATAHGMQVSSHLVPEVSVHLLAATPTAHWLEYVDWADAILEQPMQVVDGAVAPPDRPGLGMVWSEEKLRHLEVIG
ncbi:MAG: enolase C-terminal domain-like protein [Rhizobacter sp.]